VVAIGSWLKIIDDPQEVENAEQEFALAEDRALERLFGAIEKIDYIWGETIELLESVCPEIGLRLNWSGL
jgi:hypothetical protein